MKIENNYFFEIRSNRRRKHIDPAMTSLSKVFVTVDEYHILQYRIAKGRVTVLLKSRGMYVRDTFTAFDSNKDIMLSRVEFQRGLEWLGMDMDLSLDNDIMQEMDKDSDDLIDLKEFKCVVGWDEEGNIADLVSTGFNPPMLPELMLFKR